MLTIPQTTTTRSLKAKAQPWLGIHPSFLWRDYWLIIHGVSIYNVMVYGVGWAVDSNVNVSVFELPAATIVMPDGDRMIVAHRGSSVPDQIVLPPSVTWVRLRLGPGHPMIISVT